MGEPSSGLLFDLFASGQSPEPPSNTSSVVPPSSSRTLLPKVQNFFIVPPLLPPAQKALYKPVSESSLKAELEIKLDEVIGEYYEAGTLYYYARYMGGIAHKFPSKPFLEKFEGLVTEFKRKENEGELQPFDPSAHYIHPLSRVRIKISISKRGAALKDDIEDVPSSQYEDDSENDGQDDESEDDEYNGRTSTRSSRRFLKKTKDLPFSPKKTRSRRLFVLNSDQDSENGEESPGYLPRRSTRSKRSVKVHLDAEGYGDSENISDEDDSGNEIRKRSKAREARGKKVVRRRVSRPAYGHFRAIVELDYDSHSDQETAPLRQHRDICEKCHRNPAHQLIEAWIKKSKIKGKKRKKTSDDEFDESIDEEEKYTALGGWVRCLKCPVVAHWRCLASTQRDEILKAARDRDRAEWQRLMNNDVSTIDKEPGKRSDLDVHHTTEFICGACIKGGVCMGCMEVALDPDSLLPKHPENSSPQGSDIVMADNSVSVIPSKPVDETTISTPHGSGHELLFRCLTCKRVAHYSHLPLPSTLSSDDSLIKIAQFYTRTWLCADCITFRDGVDKILAWRPYPPGVVEPPYPPDEPPNYKHSLPREYLVKWLDRSYRRLQWVPHMWLVSTHHMKLKNFLTGGSKVELLQTVEEEQRENDPKEGLPSIFDIGDGSRASSVKPGAVTPALPHEAIPDAERRIPPAWKTIDRVLNVLVWRPRRRESHKGRAKKKAKELEDVNEDEVDESVERERTLAFEHGEQPSEDLMESIEEWESRTYQKFSSDNIDSIVWVFVKWEDLGYDQATWDSPPRSGDLGYASFQVALQHFIDSRDVVVPKHSKPYCLQFDNRAKDEYRSRHILKDASNLDLGQNSQLKLMPFQVDGFNWLCNNWWIHQNCILADDMGLGKTVQIATFLGNIAMNFKAFPALVVVPNSTITNWVREFERWAPKLRVVPFYGEAKARDVIKKFELLHETKRPGETGAKYHILITTYEALLNPKDFGTVFKNQPRWEVLVVDEGQRLKSDSSLLFKRLNELKSIHRVIMTGTPLNNNIRELFNLMNFLDPDEWSDLEELEKEHEELTEDLVKQLHTRLRPYFLRRIKSEVLQLPPKNEVIVPVSMAPLQKEVYRSILSHNLQLLNGLTQPPNSKLNSTVSKGRINNILMQLRKCLQHPYLYAEDIEPRGLTNQETHEKLIDGSAKLRLLKSLLPRLKQRGHRVLLFSQFVIALNVIEDFLVGEGYKYLRLDGNTKGNGRQKGMDEFNKPGSDVFIYLLTTRAGGVGINLFSADTVIIFDPDFNPHQDLQAIARAYRFGQQKTCLVFKLMVKDSAEERIMQIGKKKLVLDHLIVQKMDDENPAGENVQSILTYGAQALFDSDQESRDIIYSDNDIEKLIEKTEKEGDQEEKKEGALSFGFAKIWAAEKDTLEEVEDHDQGDSWAQTLQKITEERDKIQSKEVALSGRGVRRRAAAVPKPHAYIDGDPVKIKSNKKKSDASEGSAYSGSDVDASDSTNGAPDDLTFEPSHPKSKKSQPPPLDVNNKQSNNAPLSPIHNTVRHCGLCDKKHSDGPGECIMTDSSEHLAEFREMLLLHAEDEPWEERTAAIRAIDETLYKRGHTSLIAGQPLYPLRKPSKHSTAPARVYENASANSSTKDVPRPQIQASSGNYTGYYTYQQGLATDPALMYGSTYPGSHLAVTQQSSNAIASSSKRLGSPLTSEGPPKKKKLKPSSSSLPCVICNRPPHHLVKDCPVVAEGPTSISKQIKRLENNPDPAVIQTVGVLRKLLKKQKKKETTENTTIQISD